MIQNHHRARLRHGLHTVMLILPAFVLSACSFTPPLVPAGKYAIEGEDIRLDRDWADVTKLFLHHAPKVHILSIDGLLLNRLYISDGLTTADPLMVDPAQGETSIAKAPRGKADMSLSEQMAFIADSLSTLDYKKVETFNPQPVSAGGAHGVRFEITAVTADGLKMRGLAQAVPAKGKTYYVVYIAPEMHYYAANLKNVVAVMDSVKVP